MALTLRLRVFLTQAPLLALLLLLGGGGGALLLHLGGRVDVILRENYASVMAMERLHEGLERIDSSFQFALAGREADARAQYQANWPAYREALRTEQANITLPGEAELVERLTQLTDRYRQQGDAFYGQPGEDGPRRAAYFGPGGLLDAFRSIKESSGKILRLNQANMEDASRAARRTARWSVVGFGVALGLALSLAGLSAWRTSRALLGPIRSVTQSAIDMSAGKLDQLIVYSGSDELAQMAEAFTRMATDLHAADKAARERMSLLQRANEALKAEIQDRKRAEDALRASEGALNRAQEIAHLGSWHLDLSKNRLTWSDEVFRMFGVPKGSKLTYEDFLAAIHPDDKEPVSQAWSAALRGAPYDIEHRIVLGGELKWVRERAKVEFDADGKAVEGTGTVQDITQRKQAEEEIRKLARLHAAAAELGLRALRRAPVDEVLDSAVTRLAQVLGVDYTNVVEVLPGDEELLLRAGFGWPEGLVGRARVRREGSQPGYVIRSQQPVIVADAATETRFAPLPRLLGESACSAMSVVIATPDGPFGALGAHSRRRRTFTPDEVNFLQAVANVLGSVIERQRHEARLERFTRSLRALSRCNEALVRAADEARLLQEICRIVVEEAGHRLCWVGLAEDDAACSVRPIAHAGVDDGYLAALNISWADTERGRGPTGTCIRERRIVIVRDIASDPSMGPWREEALRRGYASSIVLPLLIEPRQVGALSIYAAEPGAFGGEEVGLLRELADDLAFGITTLRTRSARDRAEAEVRSLNAELEQRVTARTAELRAAGAKLAEAREREIEIGSRIQQMLLFAEPPRDIPGLRVAALSIPSQRIDGDFYDFIRRGAGCLDLIVADVMGKGIPAALLGAAMKGNCLEAASQLGAAAEPREIVTLAHADMARQLISLESFVTLCYARLDLERRRLDLVDCGHTGVVHFRAAAGRCELVRGDNLPLGFREGEIYDQISLALDPGDVLVFFSDGVTEARGPSGDLFGSDRLLDCVRAHGALDPDGMVDAVRRAVVAFAGSDQLTDDLTCVAIQIEARPPVLARAEVDLRSDLGELRRARELVRAFCGAIPGAPLGADAVASLELAITEAASNVMRHAYRGRTDQWIHIAAEATPGQVTLRLHHLGAPFDPAAVPPPSFNGSRESGFGVYLIARSVDEVRYYRDERGRNCIALTKLFGA